MEIKKFNIRVYGLFLNESDEILLADEERFGMQMTKFPGGGLQFGEGPVDCLKREALEEFGQEIDVLEHFYTTDFFQKALFYEDQQLISIYYFARFREAVKFRITQKAFDFTQTKGEILAFRYVSLSRLSEEDLSFPVDKHVVKLLKDKIRG